MRLAKPRNEGESAGPFVIGQRQDGALNVPVRVPASQGRDKALQLGALEAHALWAKAVGWNT